MSRPKPAIVADIRSTPALGVDEPRHPDITVEEFVRAILDRMRPDEGRVLDYFRLQELSPPFSETWVKARLHDGTLKAVKLKGFGITLIEGESLRKLISSAKPWRPR